jgi:inorganic pyrophosphatase
MAPDPPRGGKPWDEQLGGIKLDRFLFASVVFPADYGFVPQTLADDGDPLDAIVCVRTGWDYVCQLGV